MNYNKLVEKIVLAVPGIIELKFGCELYIKTLTRDYGGINTYKVIGKKYKSVCTQLSETFHGQLDTEVKIVEILGRPITLEDVLRAIEKISKGFHTFAFHNGIIIMTVNGHKETFDWKLGKPLSEQSKETKEFLYKLLK